jgi:hypothetical protein
MTKSFHHGFKLMHLELEKIGVGECGQLTVEFHHRFPGIVLAFRRLENAVMILNRHGYQIFNISESGDEYCSSETDLRLS